MRFSNNLETALSGINDNAQITRSEIASLTGLRGIAACWVVFYHMVMRDNDHGNIAQAFRHGYLAVDLFFILSGFVMTLSYQGLFAHDWSWKSFFAFMMRRIARIYPLYIIILFLLSLRGLQSAIHGSESILTFLKTALCNILLIQTWVGKPSIIGASWSVSAEFAAYFLFPIMLVVASSPRRFVSACFALLSLIAVIGAAYYPDIMSVNTDRNGPLDISEKTPYLAILRCISEFTIGITTYIYYSSISIKNISKYKYNHVVKFLYITFLCIAILFSIIIYNGDILFVSLIPFLICILMKNNNTLSTILSWKPIHNLGLWSYAIYLWHGPLLFIMWHIEKILTPYTGFTLSRFIGITCCWCVLLPVSIASYRFIEVPGRKLVRRLEQILFPKEDTVIQFSETKNIAP